METIKKFFSRLYELIPSRVKIAGMVLTSTLIAGFIALFIVDLTTYSAALQNQYLKLFVVTLIPFLAVIGNLAQESAASAGTKLYASEGDKKTLAKLNKKLVETKAIIKTQN